MDYLENIIQLLAILISLLLSLFYYIGSKRRCWFYGVVFFLASLLSSYFWTAYLIIMGEDPNASDLLTYFGWNVAYFIMMLQAWFLTKEEDRRYYPLLMFIPVPLSIWQFMQYIQYGGILNNAYQVAVCTVTACLCIRGIMANMRNKERGSDTTWGFVSLLCIVYSEFGMWTSSCFGGWIAQMYYVFSFLLSISYLFSIWAITRSYEHVAEDEVLIDIKIRNILKGVFVTVLVTCSVGGILLGMWIRNVLRAGTNGSGDTEIFDIISVILFLVSIIIAAFTAAIISVVYFEQKVAENNKLREASLSAERSNAAKSDFLANMSHEIRTPINAILGMNEMILKKSREARKSLHGGEERTLYEIGRYSGNIDSAGNNLLTIINDILDLSKIEAGRMEIVDVEYKLSAVLNDVGNMILYKAKSKGLAYRVSVDETLPDGLYGDAVRIRQIMTNILNNAVKYTQQGTVRLTVGADGDSAYKVGSDIRLVITVEDTGIGIRQEDLGKLFSKFERMDLQKNANIEGTGLGLSITHKLIDMMKGTIDVKSEYGKGTAFTITIPQIVNSTEPVGNYRETFEKSLEESWSDDITFRAPDARILIVDDTPMNLTVATGLLEDTKIMTETALSGQEALRMTEKTAYDIILLDQRMPHMDGIETLHRIRTQEGGPNVETPAICLTADAITGAKERYTWEGFTDYLSKPIDSRLLKEMIMKYLPKEKVIEVSVDEDMTDDPETAADTAPSTPYDMLRAAGIDTAKGLEYCQNNESLYQTLLHEYRDGFDDTVKKLEDALAAKDMKNYAINAHSLKNISRTIGAAKVGELALILEKAADGPDEAVIAANHPLAIEEYRKVVEALKSY